MNIVNFVHALPLGGLLQMFQLRYSMVNPSSPPLWFAMVPVLCTTGLTHPVICRNSHHPCMSFLAGLCNSSQNVRYGASTHDLGFHHSSFVCSLQFGPPTLRLVAARQRSSLLHGAHFHMWVAMCWALQYPLL